MTLFLLFASRRPAFAPLVALALTISLTRCAPGTVTPVSTESSQGEPILTLAFENHARAPSDSDLASLNEWAWSRDGQYFYAAYANGIVRRINLDQGRAEAEITLSPDVSHLALSPDGRYLAAMQSMKYSIPPNTSFTLGNIPWEKFSLIGRDDLLLLDAQRLTELARRPRRGEECTLLRGMTFSPDSRSLWVGCPGENNGGPSQPVATRLAVPGLEPLQLLRAETSLPRDGNAVSIEGRVFLTGARAVMIADEDAIAATTENGKRTLDISRTISALRIIDLEVGQDLGPPIALTLPGPVVYRRQSAWLWDHDTRLTVAMLPQVNGGVQATELPSPDRLLTRVYDLRAGRSVPEADPSAAFLTLRAGYTAPDVRRIDELGVVVETWSDGQSGWVLVRDQYGVPRQSILTINQRILDVSPDGRWLAMQSDPGTLRFYHVRARP
jgi:WD40 repeat protein